MKKIATVAASFVIMLCIGGLYAWSIIASELIDHHGFSSFQSQMVFAVIIAVFPVTMIFVGRLAHRVNYRYFGYISGTLFLLGYVFASYSQGHFIWIVLSIGLLSGIATGFGYWVALTSPVQWFPEKKGLITGIAAGGFGLGAVLMSEISDFLLTQNHDVLQILKIVGIAYGLIILFVSNFIFQISTIAQQSRHPATVSQFIGTPMFRRLCLGIFLGTFAGLLVIGSLAMIGGQYGIGSHTLVIGVSVFAVSNFLGRLIWGFLSDYIGAAMSIFLALLIQSASIMSLNIVPLSDPYYLALVFLIGFGFGGNFVLFAKETAQAFGVRNLGVIYPYVFLGYAVAGIAGPISGGFLFDLSGTFFHAIILASVMSLLGSLLFLTQMLTADQAARLTN